MPRKKTKTLAASFLQYRLDGLERQVRGQMRGFQGAAPDDLRGALGVLILCHDAPEVVLESSPIGKTLRLELATFVTKFPEHAVAGLRSVYRKPQPTCGHTAIVREFLLSQGQVDLPNGKRVCDVGAMDKEIAAAAQRYYQTSTGRTLDKPIAAATAKHERQQLERQYGRPILNLVEFVLTASNGIQRRRPLSKTLAAIYKPYRH